MLGNKYALRYNYSKNFSNLQIYHQYIREIHNKLDELFSPYDSKIPQIFCFTEHYLSLAEIIRTSINQYNFGAYFCHKIRKNGGVKIFVHQNIQYTPIDLEEFCTGQEIEVCAIKLHHSTNNICILTVYRAPSGNFVYFFLNTLEVIHNKFHTNFVNIILCRYINISYLDYMDSKRLKLDSLLASYHLDNLVDFPTRVTCTSATAIDNFFMNKSINKNFLITSVTNGLSDQDAQILILNNFYFQIHLIIPSLEE
jgi:hypothetical protein